MQPLFLKINLIKDIIKNGRNKTNRVKTTSKIYNLAFENIFKDQLEERNKADNTRRSYKNWIDTVLCRSEHELLNNRPEDESKELEEFLSDLCLKASGLRRNYRK